jgi:hypothetical protein
MDCLLIYNGNYLNYTDAKFARIIPVAFLSFSRKRNDTSDVKGA